MISLLIKSIRQVSDTNLAITYDVKSEIQHFEFEVTMPLQADLNAAEAHARSRLEQFAKDLIGACQTSPLVALAASAHKRPHP